MAVLNPIGTGPVHLVDVRDTINAYGGSAGNGLTSFFQQNDANKWAKFKDVKLYANFSDDWYRGGNGLCGFTTESVVFNDVSALVAAYDSGSTFVFDPPQGGTTTPMRLGDFRKYQYTAKAPIWDFYVNRAFVSSDTASTIDCELVDNHSGINANYNLILADFGVSEWFFGCIIKAGNGYFTKKHSYMIGGSAIITNRIITVSYSEVSNRVGSFYSYKVYPCLINGAGNRFMALPSAASGGIISGGVSGSVVQQQAAVGWVGNTYYYTGVRLTFKGVLGYADSLEGYDAIVTIRATHSDGTTNEVSETITLSHTDTDSTGNYYRMDYSRLVMWSFSEGDVFTMIVLGGSSGISSTSTPIAGGNVVPLLL